MAPPLPIHAGDDQSQGQSQTDEDLGHPDASITTVAQNGQNDQNGQNGRPAANGLEPALFHKVKSQKSILALAVSESKLYAGTQGGELLVCEPDRPVGTCLQLITC